MNGEMRRKRKKKKKKTGTHKILIGERKGRMNNGNGTEMSGGRATDIDKKEESQNTKDRNSAGYILRTLLLQSWMAMIKKRYRRKEELPRGTLCEPCPLG